MAEVEKKPVENQNAPVSQDQQIGEAELTQFGVKAPPGLVRIPLGLISFVQEQAARRHMVQEKVHNVPGKR